MESLSLHDRTLNGLQKVIDRAMPHVHGFERTIVSRGVQILLPRLEGRIRAASEEGLLEELKYMHDLIGGILNEQPKKDNKAIRRRNSAQVKPRHADARTRRKDARARPAEAKARRT